MKINLSEQEKECLKAELMEALEEKYAGVN
jgi:hypothetical protein